MRRTALPLLALLLLPGCRGTVPETGGIPEFGTGISAVLIGGRIILPTGETGSGSLHVNLEMDGGRGAEVYRLPLRPQQTSLFQIEPGSYHVAPTRDVFGRHQAWLKVRIEGRSYWAQFPREILRKAAVVVKPTRIVSLGVLEAEVVQTRLPGREPVLKVRLDDSFETRRALVQNMIRDMLNPAIPTSQRESAVAWTRALEQTLSELLSEAQRGPLYKPAP